MSNLKEDIEAIFPAPDDITLNYSANGGEVKRGGRGIWIDRVEALKSYILKRTKEAQVDEILHARVGRVVSKQNKDNLTYMSGFNYAKNNLQEYKSRRLAELEEEEKS